MRIDYFRRECAENELLILQIDEIKRMDVLDLVYNTVDKKYEFSNALKYEISSAFEKKLKGDEALSNIERNLFL